VPELVSLVGLGPGLTPLGDDVLVGYLGACTLFGDGAERECVAFAELLAARTSSLSATLLRLAAQGHLPEAAHCLLEDGDPEPLLDWGASSGLGLLVGLGLGTLTDSRVVRSLELVLPFDPPRLVRVHICEARELGIRPNPGMRR
jgi:hypothetical protein